jgi:hypothetical protein
LLQVIENLEGLNNLKCLYLGKNKITKIQNLDSLKNLEVLSLQVGGTTVVTVASDKPITATPTTDWIRG